MSVEADERAARELDEQGRDLTDGQAVGAPYETWGADQAAAFLRIHVDTLYALARSGEVPACKVGRSWVFTPRLLAEYVETKSQAPNNRAARLGDTPQSYLAAKLDALLRLAPDQRPKRPAGRGRRLTA